MKKLIVSPSPHIHHIDTTQGIMLDVVIALMPAMAMSVWLFGARAIAVYAVCVVSAVLSEYITRKILKRDNTISDFSAVVTGVLLAMNLPVSIPLWMAGLGSAIAIVVVKQLFGGIGQNFVNPALIGRIVLMVSFPAAMTKWTYGDAVTSATPLATIKAGGELPNIKDLLLGTHAGCLGETCAVALLIGAIYLIGRRVISPTIPLCYMGTTALLCALGGIPVEYTLLTGGLILGACFMATDYATSPTTFKGKIVFGVGCGVLTAFIRLFGNIAEGVSFSIVIMNILVPHIEILCTNKPFGVVKEGKDEK